MAERQDRKLFLGPRLRRLRRDLGLTQAAMAAELDLSASYLNLIERNARPVTAQVLLKLAQAYELDLRAFAAEAEGGGPASLGEILADPLFRDLNLSKFEVAEFADASPGVAEAMVRLYRAYADRKRASELGALRDEEAETVVTTTDWVRDAIGAHRNYFPELDECGEALSAEIGPGSAEEVASSTRARLLARWGIRVQVLGADTMGNTLRRYDHHRKRLFVSELLGPSGRSFACAYQLALVEGAAPIDDVGARAAPPDGAARALLRVSLANYLAAATLMPYGAFLAAAEANSYDVERVKARFGASFEQCCHRLTTLSRAGARGVPFFMLRIDPAGNVSKRFASASFPFARFSGACPRWNIHASFRDPGRIVTQIVEAPDGERYFTLARTVRRPGARGGAEAGDLAIGLGCELKHASRLAYARGLDLADPLVTPIGPACRICERPECPQRAAQPVSRTLMVDDFRKTVSPYPFAPG